MSQTHESTGTYALDAFDEADLAEFEAHLDACVTCSLEITGFHEAAAELTLLTQTTPPPGLRETVVAVIRKTPQLPVGESIGQVTALSTPSRTSRPTGPRRALPGLEVRDQPGRTAVNGLALRRQRQWNELLTSVIAAMLALLVGLGGAVYTLFQQRQAQIAQVKLENELYRAPDTRTVVVDVTGGGQATFVASKQLNRAMFLGTDLPDPGPNDRYTLWTATGTGLADLRDVFLDHQVPERGSGSKQFFRGDIKRANFLALNVEPVASTPAAPTTPVLAAAPI